MLGPRADIPAGGLSVQASDIVEIQQLLSLYGHLADATIAGGHRERLSEVFTSDAVFDGRSTPVGRLHRGIEEISALFLRTSPPHPPAHQMTNPYVWAENGVVRALSKWFGINRTTGRLQCGDYVDVLVRTPAGWRISERVVTCRWWDGEAAPGEAPSH